MRADSEDVVLWLLRLIVERVPRIQSNAVIEVEPEAGLHWGGKRPYIAKHAPTETRQRAPRQGQAISRRLRG